MATYAGDSAPNVSPSGIEVASWCEAGGSD